MLMALVMAFFVGVWGGRVVFPPNWFGRLELAVLRFCVFDDLNVDKNDFSLINKSIAGFWVGFGIVLELCRVVWMWGYWRKSLNRSMVK